MNPSGLAGGAQPDFAVAAGTASNVFGQAQTQARATPAHHNVCSARAVARRLYVLTPYRQIHGTPAREQHRTSGLWTNPNAAVKSSAQRQPFGAAKAVGMTMREASASTEEVEALLGVPISRNQAPPARTFSFRSNLLGGFGSHSASAQNSMFRAHARVAA